MMRAIGFDGRLHYVTDCPVPEVPSGWARIRVFKAGICSTDLEITRGYKGFKGILGHEFVGVVEASVPQGEEPDLCGKRVVGEINVGCGQCERCHKGMERHCPGRKALGIHDLDGCMADYCVLPLANLHEVPGSMDTHRAVFVEPLSAACEIIEQTAPTGSERAAVLGDGRLGILCAWALLTVIPDVTLIGHHEGKLEKASWRGLKTRLGSSADMERHFDMVVEATGAEKGLADAMALCRPRGTIVLKSTTASEIRVNLSVAVVNEQTLVGSRCGRFQTGLSVLAAYPDMPLKRLISAQYPIEQGLTAFEQAAQPDALKVLIDIGGKE